MPKTKNNKVHASSMKCVKKCGKQAVAFYPVVDPDIRSYPYCRECLNKARNEMLIALSNEGLI